MSLSRTFAAIFALSLGAAGCASSTDDPTAVAASTADETTTCPAMQTYDHAVQAAKDAIQVSYDAAMTQFHADVAKAAATRDAKLAAIPNEDANSDQLNAIIAEYNDEVGPKGPIVQAYDASVKAAQDVFNASIKTALDAYDAKPCYQ